MEDNAILRAWKKPFNRKPHPEFSHHGRAISAACGDEIDLDIDVEGDRIRAASFDGDGCVICLGMASLLTQHLVGKTLTEVREITGADILRLATDVVIDSRRYGCALVAFKALEGALCSDF